MYIGFIFNYIFAWLAVFVGIFLLSKYLLRRSAQKAQGERRQSLVKINKSWKWPHVILGFTLIIVGLVHGYYSSVDVWSLNIGTLNWLVTTFFGLTWIFKKCLKAKWLWLHRILAVLFMITIVWHIIDVGGVKIFRLISEMNNQIPYEVVLEEDSNEMKDPEDTEVSGNKNEVLPSKKLPYYFAFEGLNLADGTYEAEDKGYSPGLKVIVTIKNQRVVGIKIASHHEIDSTYYKAPMEKVPVAILTQQTLDVDTISGATLTSVGIIKAVRKAVLESMENTSE